MTKKMKKGTVFVTTLVTMTLVFSPAVYANEEHAGQNTQNSQTSRGVDININNHNFPDDNFRQYIKDNFDNHPSDGILSTIEINNILTIDFEQSIHDNRISRISSLKGIEHFSALTYLNCYGINITSLDVSQNIKLKELKYGDNILFTSLKVKGAEALESLQCYGTGIESLDVSENRNLNYMLVSDNKLKTLDVSHNRLLNDLNCQSNEELTSLNLNGADALETLSCGWTGLQSLDISHNLSLRILECQHLDITSLDTSQHTKLGALYGYGAKITSLDMSHNTLLYNLDCREMPIKWLNVGNNPRLLYVGLTETNITLQVTGNTFNIKNVDNGIDPNKVTIISNGSIDHHTGVVSIEQAGQPVIYAYDCGTTSYGKPILKVKINSIITKQRSTITIKGNLDMSYTGNPISPTVEITGSIAKPTFTYEKYNGVDWEPYTTAPKDIGQYRVKAHLADNGFSYRAESDFKTFTISRATNSWIKGPFIKDYPFGEQLNLSNVKARFGNMTYTYSDSKDGPFTHDIPIDVGTWYVKATTEGTTNYSGIESVIEFTILQATNSWINEPSIKDWTYGEKPNTSTAKARFGKDIKFTYSALKNGPFINDVPTKAGTWYMRAFVERTDNYQELDTIKLFTIKPKNVEGNKQIIISEIKNYKDIENIVIKDIDKELVKGVDYDVHVKKKDQKITVEIVFKGNYYGTMNQSYILNKNNSVKTEDYSHIGIFTMMSLLSLSGVVMVMRKLKE